MGSTDIILPQVNVNDSEILISHWYVSHGSFIEEGADILDLGTSKAALTMQCPSTGYLEIVVPVGRRAKVGSIIGRVYPEAHQVPSPSAELPGVASDCNDGRLRSGFTRLSKALRGATQESARLEREFAGFGLVTERFRKRKASSSRIAPDAEAAVGGTTALVGARTIPPASPATQRRKLSRAKQIEIDYLSAGQSGNVISSITVDFSIARLQEQFKDHTFFSRSLLPLVLYEFAKLLEKYPEFNGYYDNDAVALYDGIHIGVAFDMGEGLRVPILKDANRLLPAEIAERLTQYGFKYLRGQMVDQDLIGGTVTVTDLSSLGIKHFQPLVNANQSAILGVGKGGTGEATELSFTMAFDHRVLTGFEVATFLGKLRKKIQSYEEQERSQ